MAALTAFLTSKILELWRHGGKPYRQSCFTFTERWKAPVPKLLTSVSAWQRRQLTLLLRLSASMRSTTPLFFTSSILFQDLQLIKAIG